MNYKDIINPELRSVAINMPYNKFMIKGAYIFLPIMYKFTKIPEGISNKCILIKGYNNLSYKVDIFEPDNASENLPCLIYIHGGGFSYKAAPYHKQLACTYALKAHCRVYFPDYHLTPKYPYPAAYEDVLALYKHVMNKNDRIGVVGDSAGGTIAAMICNNYQKENIKQPYLQMLIYPVTDIDMQTDSMKKYVDTPLWNAKNNKRMWSYYCNDIYNKENVSPMYSHLPENIPQTYIETTEYDCLHDEGVLYAKKLQEAKVYVEINETKRTIHGYDFAINSSIAKENIDKRIRFLKKIFYE